MNRLKKMIQTLKPSAFADIRTQVSAATSVSLSFFTAGMVRAWASPALPTMQGKEVMGENYGLSLAPLSKEQVSWISSLAPLGALIGSSLSSYPLSKFGRRKTLLIAATLFFFAFILLGMSSLFESLVTILLARGVMGAAVGLAIPAAQIYISECTETRIRGTLSSFPAMFMALGTLITYIVGAFLPWHFLSYFCAGFPVMLLLAVAALPESPTWLITNGFVEKGSEALSWFRNGKNIKDELTILKENINRSKAQTYEDPEALSSTKEPFLMPLLQKPVLLPLFISTGLMFFQQWSGVNAIIFYTVSIFTEAAKGNEIRVIDENFSTVVIGIVQFLATFVSMFLVDKAGRKILLLVSGLVMSLSSGSVGTYFYLKSHDMSEGLELLPLIGMIVFMIGYSIGFASIPFVLLGELFPNRYRNLLGGVSSTINLTHTFLVIKLFTNIQTIIGMDGVFWLYSASSLVSCLFVLIFLPETKGKSLEDIETHFRKTNEK